MVTGNYSIDSLTRSVFENELINNLKIHPLNDPLEHQIVLNYLQDRIDEIKETYKW